MARNYQACLAIVSSEHLRPPRAFLDQLIDTIQSLPDEVFAVNALYDVYSVVKSVLGPYEGLMHRRAVMCEVLRVVAAFESDWNWNEGVDVHNQRSRTHKIAEETGAFQASADSMVFDASLMNCVDRACGAHDPDTFIANMKSNHALAVEYCARLLRFNTTWCGTMPRVRDHVSRDAVEEFKGFLESAGGGGDAALAPEQQLDEVQNAVDRILGLAQDPARWDTVQSEAAGRLLRYDGEQYPTDGCAITLSVLFQMAGLDLADTYRAIDFGRTLEQRGWNRIEVGKQKPGDVGSTCGDQPQHGVDHVYLVVEVFDPKEMLVADNQKPTLHKRRTDNLDGKSPTRFFLRATPT
ncbi:MAG TPA: hypothetical protein VG820_12995 [Fimbriimonadaceae bacterium]|nr:hypothetical protein [Fimbriimonadaceae bacterium]